MILDQSHASPVLRANERPRGSPVSMNRDRDERDARVGRIWTLTLTVLIFVVAGADAQQQQQDLIGSEALQLLRNEQSLAERYVVLLETVRNNDFNRYSDGVRLYAIAKAGFDGLIEQMKQDIIKGVPFDHSAKFQTVLQTAVARRLAFTQHVDEIVEVVGVRSGVTDHIAGAGGLQSALTAAAKAIWDSYWSVQESNRKETLAQLNALKWRAFHDIVPPSG